MEFKEVILKEIAVIKNGKKPKTKKSTGNYPIYGSNGIIGYTDNAYIHEDSIIIGRVGANCGSVIFSNGGFWVSDNAISVVPKESTDVYYLYYLLITKRINEYSSGSAQPLINQSILNSIPLMLPCYAIQKRIGNVLKNFDAKINLNSQVISNLEHLGQTIFKRWFVDFDFPNENGDPHKSSGGELVQSELGMIPNGWSSGKLSDIAILLMGQSPKSNTYNEDGLGMPLINGASDFKKDHINPLKHTTDPKRVSQKGDFLFGVRATVGNVTYVDKEYALGRGVGVARANSEEYREILYSQLINGIDYLKNIVTG